MVIKVDMLKFLQTLMFSVLIIPSLVSANQDKEMVVISNKSFFNMKPTTIDEKVGHRVRRSTIYTESEIDAIVDKHNEFRNNVNPTASNMKFMHWDDDLASMAQEWSEGCIWEHGNPSNISPFNPIGQNLYMAGSRSSVNSVSAAGPVTVWHGEVNYYNYAENSCSWMCGHYTQVVWASTYAVGCGKAFCPTVTSSGFTNAVIVTCNYGPAGNYPTRPYLSGVPCTACGSGVNQCYGNQCRPCSEHSEPCVCKAACQNCGKVTSDCTCDCVEGWLGADCGTLCENTHHYCGANPGWPAFTCSQVAYVRNKCPLMCGICTAPDPDFICVEESEGESSSNVDESSSLGSDSDDDSGDNDHSCEPVLSCQNGGEFSSITCECDCTDDYQGDECQQSVEQARYGVRVRIVGNIDRFPSIEDLLHQIIAQILNVFCNDNFQECCPDSGTKTSDTVLTFTEDTDVETAEGYPEEDESDFWVMLIVSPQPDNDLCSNGTGTSRRRRSPSLIRLPRNIGNTGNSSGYLSQDTLLEAIEENIDQIESSLNVTIGGVEAGVVESELGSSSGTPGWAVSLAVIFTLVAIAVVGVIVTYFLLKKFKPDLLTRWTSRWNNTIKRSTSKVGIKDECSHPVEHTNGIDLNRDTVVMSNETEMSTSGNTNEGVKVKRDVSPKNNNGVNTEKET